MRGLPDMSENMGGFDRLIEGVSHESRTVGGYGFFHHADLVAFVPGDAPAVRVVHAVAEEFGERGGRGRGMKRAIGEELAHIGILQAVSPGREGCGAARYAGIW